MTMTRRFSPRMAVALAPAALAAFAVLSTSACGDRAKKADCASPEVFCVGLVTDVGKVDDKSFNQSAWEAVQKAKTELGATAQYIETTDPKDYNKNISTFGDEKYDVVVTAGFGLGEATQAAAAQFPGVKFIGVDQFQAPGTEKPNVAGLIFPEDQAGFLVGALAAMLTRSGKIGAVLATDAVPPVYRFGEGYRMGARHVKPEIDISLVYHNDVGFDKTFSDPEWGKTTAVSMVDKGVDIVFGAGGKTGNGALIGAASKGVYAIGVDTDQYFTVPEAQKSLVSSGMKLITDGTFELLKLAKAGDLPKGNFLGKVGYAPYHDLDSKVPAEVKAKMEELKSGLASGAIKTNVPAVKPGQ